MTFRKAEAKVAAVQALKQLGEFTQYVEGLVDRGTLTANVMEDLTKKIHAFEQQVIATLGDRYQPTTASLPRPQPAAAAGANGIPANPNASKAPGRAPARSLHSLPGALVEEDD
jgi:hypothetical protein